MARTISIPSRATASAFSDAEVFDVLATLLTLPTGQAVIVADDQDTEPKARVRCRNMTAALKSGADGCLADIEDDEVRKAYAESNGKAIDAAAKEYTKAHKDDADAPAFDPESDFTFSLDGVNTKGHVIATGAMYTPAVSRKS